MEENKSTKMSSFTGMTKKSHVKKWNGKYKKNEMSTTQGWGGAGIHMYPDKGSPAAISRFNNSVGDATGIGTSGDAGTSGGASGGCAGGESLQNINNQPLKEAGFFNALKDVASSVKNNYAYEMQKNNQSELAKRAVTNLMNLAVLKLQLLKNMGIYEIVISTPTQMGDDSFLKTITKKLCISRGLGDVKFFNFGNAFKTPELFSLELTKAKQQENKRWMIEFKNKYYDENLVQKLNQIQRELKLNDNSRVAQKKKAQEIIDRFSNTKEYEKLYFAAYVSKFDTLAYLLYNLHPTTDIQQMQKIFDPIDINNRSIDDESLHETDALIRALSEQKPVICFITIDESKNLDAETMNRAFIVKAYNTMNEAVDSKIFDILDQDRDYSVYDDTEERAREEMGEKEYQDVQREVACDDVLTNVKEKLTKSLEWMINNDECSSPQLDEKRIVIDYENDIAIITEIKDIIHDTCKAYPVLIDDEGGEIVITPKFNENYISGHRVSYNEAYDEVKECCSCLPMASSPLVVVDYIDDNCEGRSEVLNTALNGRLVPLILRFMSSRCPFNAEMEDKIVIFDKKPKIDFYYSQEIDDSDFDDMDDDSPYNVDYEEEFDDDDTWSNYDENETHLEEDIHPKFKRDIKREYKNWDRSKDYLSKKRKEAEDFWGDDFKDEEKKEKFIDTIAKKPKDFSYEFPKGIEHGDYPFYVTYYKESPHYHPEEGGYYIASSTPIASQGFNDIESAKACAKEWADEDGDFEPYEWGKDITGYKISSKYIGAESYICVEPHDSYLFNVTYDRPYESLEQR